MDIIKQLAQELHLRTEQIENAVALLDDGKTVPFIARYRKEQTGSLDDQTLHALNERLAYLRKLEERKEEVIAAVTALEKMTPELAEACLTQHLNNDKMVKFGRLVSQYITERANTKVYVMKTFLKGEFPKKTILYL